MHTAVPLACFLSIIRPPGIMFEDSLLQIAPVDKSKCPYIHDGHDVMFQLYTRHNPTIYQELTLGGDVQLASSNINFKDPTVIYFHAFMEEPDEGSGLMIREAYLLRGQCNLIMVDARRLEAGPWYPKAAENTWYIGRFAARFIDYLVSRGLDLSRTHLVGHSLGAQSAGVAGSALASGRVSRITGLDPALPLFAKLPPSQRLDPSDAHFVDVIHTDAGIFGVNEPVGHADFYPNGGISPQPGCELEVVLPQQLLLNKCDGVTRLHGFYSFYLGPKHTVKTKKDYTLKKHRKPFTDKNRFFNNLIYSTAKTAQLRPTSSHELDVTSTQSYKRVKTIQTKLETPELKLKTQKFTQDIKMIYYMNKTSTQENRTTTQQQTQIREKRFIPFLKQTETSENDNFLFRILDFLWKNRKSALPVFTVMKEINTLVKSANGELNHFIKERNNYIGGSPPLQLPTTYSLELGNDSRVKAFIKRLLGFGPNGDRLTITGGSG